MGMAPQVQNLNVDVCISHSANPLGKVINPTILLSVMVK